MTAVAPPFFVLAAAAPSPERPWWAVALLVAGGVALVAGVVLIVRSWRAGGVPSRHAAPPGEMTPAQAWLSQSSPSSAAATAAGMPRIPRPVAIAVAAAGVVAVSLGIFFVTSAPGGAPVNAAATSAAKGGASAPATKTAKFGPRFVSGNPELCLAAASSGVGAPLVVARCNGSKTQQWLPADDGTIRLGELCMDVAGAETADGTVVQVAECNGNPAQQFVIDGGKLVSDLAGKCVDVVSSRVVQGVGIAIRPCDGLAGRTWTYAR
jgi:hypothetical protein